MTNTRSSALAAALSCASLMFSACKVGPDYRKTHVETPKAFPDNLLSASTASVIDPAAPPWIKWWTKFEDPKLNSLIARAVSANHELAQARARVLEARAVERIAKSGLYPTIDISAAFAKTHGSSAGFGFPYGLPGLDSNLYQLGFDATYEVDIFGGIRRSIEAAGDIAEAADDERRLVQLALLAEVARNYITLRALQRRLQVANDNLADQRKTLEIVQRRFNNGLAPNFDLVRASAQVAGTESTLPSLQSGIHQTIYELGILLGQQPTSLETELAVETPLPPIPPRIPVGIPSELLHRRPDVMRAERLLAAATAEQGVATADLFPHLILGGTAGVQSRHADQLFDQHTPSSGFYAAGPLASWTIFDGGRRFANIDRSKARVAGAVDAYEGTILSALRDVDSSLTAYLYEQSRHETLTRLTAENQEAVRIAQNQYSHGLVDLLDVLEVQKNLYAAQDALTQSDQALSLDLVALYKALGGGWEDDTR